MEFRDKNASVNFLSTVRRVFSIVFILDLNCSQNDAVNAFLNGNPEEKNHMDVPARIRDPRTPNLNGRSRKALYGLKQALRLWYAKNHDSTTKVPKLENFSYELCLCTFCKKCTFL